MTLISKIDLSKQVKVTKLTPTELDDVLLDNETILYQNSDDDLILASKVNNIIGEKTVFPTKINDFPIPALPTTPPAYGQAYVLGLCQYGTGFTYQWVLVPTTFNYNDPTGTGITTGLTYSVTVTHPTGQIFVNNTLVANGSIQINTLSTISKKFSIDNGVTWSPFTTNQSYNFNNIGSSITETFNIIVKDSLDNTLYQDTATMDPLPTYYFRISDAYGFLVPTIELPTPFSINATKVSDSYYGGDSGKVRVDITDTQTGALYAYAKGGIFGDPDELPYTNPMSSKTYTFEDLAPGTHVFAVKKYRRNFVSITEAIINGVSETITPSWSYSTDNAVSFLPASTPTLIFYPANESGDKAIYLKNNNNFVYLAETVIAEQFPSGSELKTASAVVFSVSSYSHLSPVGNEDTPFNVSPFATGITFSCIYYPTGYPSGTTMYIEYNNLTSSDKGVTTNTLTTTGNGMFSGTMVIDDEFTLEPDVLNIIKYRFWMYNNVDYWFDVSDFNYFQIDLKP